MSWLEVQTKAARSAGSNSDVGGQKSVVGLVFGGALDSRKLSWSAMRVRIALKVEHAAKAGA